MIVVDELPVVWDVKFGGEGYFAGVADGKVTINKQGVQREIICFDATTLKVVRRVWSFNNGHFLVPALNPRKQYMLIARDHKREYKPIGWDGRTPATKMTYEEQQQKLAEWEND